MTKEERYQENKRYYEKQYKHLREYYGVNHHSFTMLYEKFNSSVFCPENRKAIICAYLTFEEFVENAKEYNIPYYLGIDTFLEVYHDAVYGCLKLD